MIPNLKTLNDAALLDRTHALVRTERETTTLILHHIREIERRYLYADRGFSSLFEYCVKELGYSEASAQRRIASMRLLKELPEIEDKIKKGVLNLSIVAQAQTFFKREAKANHTLRPSDKLEVIRALEGKSARDAEKELLKYSSNPAPIPSERIRPVTETHSELRLTLKQETLDDLEHLKGLLAHAHPDLSWSELVSLLAKIALQKLDPGRQPERHFRRRKWVEKSIGTC